MLLVNIKGTVIGPFLQLASKPFFRYLPTTLTIVNTNCYSISFKMFKYNKARMSYDKIIKIVVPFFGQLPFWGCSENVKWQNYSHSCASFFLLSIFPIKGCSEKPWHWLILRNQLFPSIYPFWPSLAHYKNLISNELPHNNCFQPYARFFLIIRFA